MDVDYADGGIHAASSDGGGIFVEGEIDDSHGVALTGELCAADGIAAACFSPELGRGYQTEIVLSRQPTATC